MSLELAAVIVLFLLVPAYPIQLGLKGNSRFQLKASTLKEPLKTVELLTISSVPFIILVPFYICIGSLLWEHAIKEDFLSIFFQKEGLFVYSNGEQKRAFRVGFWFYTAAFYMVSLWLAYHSAKWYIGRIETGQIQTSIHHGIMYNLVKGTDAPVIYCSVLTNIECDGGYLMYRGRLQDVAYLSENKIDYLVLREVNRFVLPKENEKNLKSSDFDRKRFYPVSYFKEGIENQSPASPAEIMYFDGQQIVNALFSRIQFEYSK